MQVGSLVERNPNYNLYSATGESLEGLPGLLPKSTPVVISDWKYGDRSDPDLFYFQLAGYETYLYNNKRVYFWYAATLLVELQPPMDLTFMEEMQQPKQQKVI